MNGGSRLRTVLAVGRAVTIAVALSLAGLLLVRATVPYERLVETNDFVENFLQSLASIYAVLLAFVVFVVWSQFNDARTLVEREANELLDLYRTARTLPAQTRDPLCREVAAYVEEVLTHEWAWMATAKPHPMTRGAELLDALWNHVSSFEPKTERESVVFAEILSRFNDLSDLRIARITASRLRIPLALRIFVYTGAAMTVGSMFLMGLRDVFVHALATGALAGALSNILYVMNDLDNCFDGEWQVPRSAFERVAAYVHKCSGVGSD